MKPKCAVFRPLTYPRVRPLKRWNGHTQQAGIWSFAQDQAAKWADIQAAKWAKILANRRSKTLKQSEETSLKSTGTTKVKSSKDGGSPLADSIKIRKGKSLTDGEDSKVKSIDDTKTIDPSRIKINGKTTTRQTKSKARPGISHGCLLETPPRRRKRKDLEPGKGLGAQDASSVIDDTVGNKLLRADSLEKKDKIEEFRSLKRTGGLVRRVRLQESLRERGGPTEQARIKTTTSSKDLEDTIRKIRQNGKAFEEIWRRRSERSFKEDEIDQTELVAHEESVPSVVTELEWLVAPEEAPGLVSTSSLKWISETGHNHDMPPLEDYLMQILSVAHPGIDRSLYEIHGKSVASIQDFAAHRGITPEDGSNTSENAASGVTTLARMSLKRIVAGYIDVQLRRHHLSSEDYDILLLDAFNLEKLDYMASWGVEVEDIVSWAWILDNTSDIGAALRLVLLSNRPMPSKRPPVWILLILIERHNTRNALALQVLVRHLWHVLANQLDPMWLSFWTQTAPTEVHLDRMKIKSEARSQIAAATLVDGIEDVILDNTNDSSGSLAANHYWILPERVGSLTSTLIRNAHKVMPALLPNIAMMMCKYAVNGSKIAELPQDGHDFSTIARLTEMFNMALCRIGYASRESYVNAAYLERAQFIILRYMHEFSPSLAVDSQAYRSIVSVQLKRRKTYKERIWGDLKSRAWPPYREDKIGLDALKKDSVYGISRAQRAIRNRKEAGFANTEWENTASILSGWNIDQSPTIQTRSWLQSSRQPFPDITDSNAEDFSSAWEARIRATRTVDEAWAMFLKYMRQPELETTEKVFLAMFEKLSREQHRMEVVPKSYPISEESAIPGDGTETWSTSHNPRDMVYTSEPPPTVDDFYRRFRTQFPIQSHYALNSLLENATSLKQGLEFIQNSSLDEDDKDLLLGRIPILFGASYKFPNTTFIAYTKLLCRFPSTAVPYLDSTKSRKSALSHAVDLIRRLRPTVRGPYVFLLGALESTVGISRRGLFALNDWALVGDILSWMDQTRVGHDSSTLLSICVIYNRLTRLLTMMQEDGAFGIRRPQFHQEMRDLGLLEDSTHAASFTKLVKGIFSRMVSSHLTTSLPLHPAQTRSPVPTVSASEHSATEIRDQEDSTLTTEDSPGESEIRLSPKHTMEKSFLPIQRSRSNYDMSAEHWTAAMFLPHILYAPTAASMHMFIRFLAIHKDKQAILDLLRWLSVFDDEVQVKIQEKVRGPRHFRWLLIAARIGLESSKRPFLIETSWKKLKSDDDVSDEMMEQAKSIIDGMPSWGGWPSNEEVEDYLQVHIAQLESFRG